MFLRNVTLYKSRTTSHPRRRHSSQLILESCYDKETDPIDTAELAQTWQNPM
jgi:hypothetical protein